jgi:hypothetical protein
MPGATSRLPAPDHQIALRARGTRQEGPIDLFFIFQKSEEFSALERLRLVGGGEFRLVDKAFDLCADLD